LCMISVDRYCAVSQPLRYAAQRTRQRIFCYVIIVWILSLIVSISPLVIWPAKNTEGKCQVIQNPVYQIYATIIAFYGPTCIMVILYAKMWLAAKRLSERDRLLIVGTNRSVNGTILAKPHSPASLNEPSSRIKFYSQQTLLTISEYEFPFNRTTELKVPYTINHNFICPMARCLSPVNGNNSSSFPVQLKLLFYNSSHAVHINKFHEKSEGKARKTLGIMMSVFVICWLPFFLLALLKSQGFLPPNWLDHLALWLGYSNSLMNPLIYCKHNREFRIPIREMLCCRFRTLHSVMRKESFTSKYGPSR
uniref:G_PROTEIN_RECEP_F1_2 domain-containing protein n=1 Tax=Brugia timori TaxID=42155 RepID=A0A0R3QZP7_9BILA